MEFNLGTVNEAIAAAVPDHEALVWRDRRLTHAQLAERSRRLANVLVDHRFTVHAERDSLEGWESGQDHLGLYLHNGNEYIEGMLGAYKARVAPFNVNYRYVEEELIYLLNDSRAKGLVYHAAFAPRVAAVRGAVPSLELLLQVDDGSGEPLLPGALDYEAALAEADDAMPTTPSPDDLYILYTGGTTGMPKGVLWRQADIFCAALGGRATGEEFESMEAITAAAAAGALRGLPAAPFMHGAAHWMAFTALNGGSAIVLPSNTTTLDAADIWSTVEREKVSVLLIVGDAFARPLLDELDRGSYDTSSMFMLVSGGAALGAPLKSALLERIPNMLVMDGLGSSEAGTQGRQIVAAGGPASTGTFTPEPGMCVVDEDMTRILEGPDTELGWLAQAGRVPLGYLGDADKTRRTFPIIDGVRLAVPGDRARIDADGLLELHGRDSVTINSGGEKIFAEEVEQAIAHHPAIYDVVVTGRPSERWGNEVVAVVQVREGMDASIADLLEECGRHVARYKLPKDIIFVDKVVRSPAGKADYRWARSIAEAHSNQA